jgi:hypothetical protein
MRGWLLLLILVALAGCGAASQPESVRMVAAFEIPLASKAERTEFLSVLRTAADAQGRHVDAATDDELEREARVIPTARRTLSAAVWRGANDEESVASAMVEPASEELEDLEQSRVGSRWSRTYTHRAVGAARSTHRHC